MAAGLLIFFYLLLITPVQAGVILHLGGGLPPRGAGGLLLWGGLFRFRVRARLSRDQKGTLRLETTIHGGKPYPPPPETLSSMRKGLRFFRGLLKANHARKLLFRFLHLDVIQILAHIGGHDAAKMALITGLLRALSSLLPRLTLRTRPVFSAPSSLSFRCIVRARLGMLLAVCLLGGLSLLAVQPKEEKPWNIPSGT